MLRLSIYIAFNFFAKIGYNYENTSSFNTKYLIYFDIISYLFDFELFTFVIMNVVENIVKIRREKGISQEFIANSLGVDTAVVSNIENGKRELKVKELEVISKALGVDTLYLLTYPHVYVRKERDNYTPVETVLQLKLTGEKRDKILKLIFGDADLRILNEL